MEARRESSILNNSTSKFRNENDLTELIDMPKNEASEETYDAVHALQSGSWSDNDNPERIKSYTSIKKKISNRRY